MAPVDQVLFGSEDVNTMLSPSQIVVESLAEIVGMEDTGITVTVTGLLVLEHPLEFV